MYVAGGGVRLSLPHQARQLPQGQLPLFTGISSGKRGVSGLYLTRGSPEPSEPPVRLAAQGVVGLGRLQDLHVRLAAPLMHRQPLGFDLAELVAHLPELAPGLQVKRITGLPGRTGFPPQHGLL